MPFYPSFSNLLGEDLGITERGRGTKNLRKYFFTIITISSEAGKDKVWENHTGLFSSTSRVRSGCLPLMARISNFFLPFLFFYRK